MPCSRAPRDQCQEEITLSALDQPYVYRPARMDDVEGVVEVCNAWTLKARGIHEHDVERQRVNWQRSGFDLDSDTRVVEDATGTLIAYAVVSDTLTDYARIRGSVYVLPDCEDAALGEALLDWIEIRARHSIPQTRHETRVAVSHLAMAQDELRGDLLLRKGYRLVHHSVRMRYGMSAPPDPVILPDGISIRSFDRGKDLPAISAAVQEAFRNHWGFVRRDFDEDVARYERWLDDDPGIDPAVWHLACVDGNVVGVCLGTTRYSADQDQAYIFTLGVRDAWRGRGIGRALLLHAFATFYEKDRSVVDLDVDTVNVTGALRLYESVGMHPLWQIDEYEKELRPGVDLTRRG